jgi:hypothetical protein
MKSSPLLTLNKTASGAIAPYRIVKATAADGVVAQAAAATDKMVGVSGQAGAADTERIDIEHAGVAPVEYGGNVAYGDPLTSDAQGRAVVAVLASRQIGIAQEAGDLGTIGSMLLAPAKPGA